MWSGPRSISVPPRPRMTTAVAAIGIVLMAFGGLPMAQAGPIAPRVEETARPARPGDERSPSPSAAADAGSAGGTRGNRPPSGEGEDARVPPEAVPRAANVQLSEEAQRAPSAGFLTRVLGLED